MRKNDGGPAFPRPMSEDRKLGDQAEGNRNVGEQDGMSLRDYFAGQAMNAIASLGVSGEGPDYDAKRRRVFAVEAYLISDAMLEAREKGGSNV